MVDARALNKAAPWWRRRGAERRALRRHGPDDTVEQPRATADELAVHEALAGCSDRQQRVLLLRWFLGPDVAETADCWKSHRGTVRSATHRALADYETTATSTRTEPMHDLKTTMTRLGEVTPASQPDLDEVLHTGCGDAGGGRQEHSAAPE